MAKRSAIPKSKAKNAYELLDEVRALILAEPKRYDQDKWLVRRTESNEDMLQFPSCGTIGCVAGWVVTLKGDTSSAIEPAAADILGLDMWSAMDLFDSSAANHSPQTLKHAKSGAAHIRRFQKAHADTLKAKRV